MQACKQNNINVDWIRENDKTIQLLKTDFVVFEKFEGEYFNYVVANSKSA